MVVYIKDKKEFDEILQKAGSKLVVIDFTATWCGPCKMIAPIFEKMAEENPEAEFYKIDVDENEEVPAECKVSCMPTFQFFKNGSMIENTKLEGADQATLLARVKQHK